MLQTEVSFLMTHAEQWEAPAREEATEGSSDSYSSLETIGSEKARRHSLPAQGQLGAAAD